MTRIVAHLSNSLVVDELVLDVAPMLLGVGERLFDESFVVAGVEVLPSPLATHIRYRIRPLR